MIIRAFIFQKRKNRLSLWTNCDSCFLRLKNFVPENTESERQYRLEGEWTCSRERSCCEISESGKLCQWTPPSTAAGSLIHSPTKCGSNELHRYMHLYYVLFCTWKIQWNPYFARLIIHTACTYLFSKLCYPFDTYSSVCIQLVLEYWVHQNEGNFFSSLMRTQSRVLISIHIGNRVVV